MSVIQEMLKNPTLAMQRYESFKKEFMQKNMNPQSAVQQLLNEGKMSQAQYEEYRGVAKAFGINL